MDESLLSVIQSLPSAAISDILSLGVCGRCAFRFFGVRDPVYSDSAFVQYLHESIHATCGQQSNAIEVDEGSSQSSQKGNPCIVCLGILHTLDTGEDTLHGEKTYSQAEIVKTVKEQGHDFDTFCLEVTLPGSVLIRERALLQYLESKYGNENYFKGIQEGKHLVALKEALRLSLTKPLEKLLDAVYDSTSAYKIALHYKHAETLNELDSLGSSLSTGNKRKWNGTNKNGGGCAESTESLAAINRYLSSLSHKEFADLYPCPPSKCNQICCLNVSCHRNSIYIGGRYLKFSRNLSQTRWLIDDERMGDGSVQEVIADVVFPHFRADSYKFHAAGREDIDVRMLGNGRPFILEVVNARKFLSCDEIQKIESSLNSLRQGWVKVRNLKQVGNEAWTQMLEGESEKQKEYTAVIWLSRTLNDSEIDEITNTKDLEIQQNTPVRVLHRRSPLVRPRIIHWMRLERILGADQFFLLHLCTQAGTYIKEFVHGDLGRTYPNIGSIFKCEAEILQLDVTDIKMDLFN